jgi:hypothetical protein
LDRDLSPPVTTSSPFEAICQRQVHEAKRSIEYLTHDITHTHLHYMKHMSDINFKKAQKREVWMKAIIREN